MMVALGDVVVADFPAAVQVKRRPAVVLSSEGYHRERPDVILGLITGNISAATAQTDHSLTGWQAAGLHRPSAFRSYLITIDRRDVYRQGWPRFTSGLVCYPSCIGQGNSFFIGSHL